VKRGEVVTVDGKSMRVLSVRYADGREVALAETSRLTPEQKQSCEEMQMPHIWAERWYLLVGGVVRASKPKFLAGAARGFTEPFDLRKVG
jgi:hypothetical protein